MEGLGTKRHSERASHRTGSGRTGAKGLRFTGILLLLGVSLEIVSISPADALTTDNYWGNPGQVVIDGSADCATSYDPLLNYPYHRDIATAYTQAFPVLGYSESSQKLASRAWISRYDGTRWVTEWASSWTAVGRRTHYINGRLATYWNIPAKRFDLGYLPQATSPQNLRFYAVGVYYEWQVNGVPVARRWVSFGSHEYKTTVMDGFAPRPWVRGTTTSGYCEFK